MPLKKKVILITSDPVQDAPADIRHYDFIRCRLNDHVSFLNKLDNALRNAFGEKYDGLYEAAKIIFAEFKLAMKSQTSLATKELFLTRVMTAEKEKELPPLDDESAIRNYVLPRIIADTADELVMTEVVTWLLQKK